MNWHQATLDSAMHDLIAGPHADGIAARAAVRPTQGPLAWPAQPGTTRWLAVLSGGGLRVHAGDASHDIVPASAALRLDGSVSAQAQGLGEPGEVFELVAQGVRAPTLERIAGRCERACRKGALVGVYSHAHELAFLAVEVRIVIPPRTLAWNVVPLDERFEIDTGGALWFEVAP